MRLFCVAVLSLCFVGLPSNGSQQQKPSNSEQGRTTQPKPESPVSVSENHYHAANQADPTTEQSKRWPPPWYSTFWPNWAFVVVGLGAAIAALWTLFVIKDQASHMSNQVTLLDQQLAAFIEGQRPQIAADPHDNPAHDILDPKGSRLQMDIWNVGLTTAYDVTYETWIEVVNPPFVDFSIFAEHFVSTEPFSLHSKHRAILINIPLNRELTDSEQALIRSRHKEVCVRMLVKYRDAWEPQRYANFGYIIDSEGLRLLPKYRDSN